MYCVTKSGATTRNAFTKESDGKSDGRAWSDWTVTADQANAMICLSRRANWLGLSGTKCSPVALQKPMAIGVMILVAGPTVPTKPATRESLDASVACIFTVQV